MLNSKTLNEAQALMKEVEMIKINIRLQGNSPFYYARFTIDGKRHEISTKETDKRQAKKVAENLVYETLARKKYPQTLGSHSFAEAYERRFIDGLKKNDKLYLNWFNKKLKDCLLSEIDKDTIWKLKQKYRKEANKKQQKIGKPPIKNQSINRAFKPLYGTLSLCVEWDWLEHAPKEQKLKPEPPKARRPIEPQEYKAIKKAAVQLGLTNVIDMVDWYIASGFRYQEAFNIKKEHIDLNNATLLIPDQKNQKHNQIVYLNSVQLKIVTKYINTKGEMLFDATNYRKRWEKVRALAGVPDIVTHSLRHTAATVVAKNCKNQDELKEFTRHKSDKGLEPYKHHIQEEDKKQIQEKATAFFND